MNGHESLLEQIKCNLCGSEEYSVLVRTSMSPFGTISNLVKCEQCGLVYFNPRHSLSKELEYYRLKYHEVHQEAYGEAFWYESKINFFKTALERIESFCPGKGSLLDVGCGMGFFLKEAKDRGWKQALGVEVSHLALDYANRKLGLEVLEGGLREVNFPENYFDVATAWNVIDQLQDPVDTLKEMYRVMKSDGLIALRVSNLTFHFAVHRLSNLLERFFGRGMTFPTRGCFHIYAFSPSSIRLTLRRIGYLKLCTPEGGRFLGLIASTRLSQNNRGCQNNQSWTATTSRSLASGIPSPFWVWASELRRRITLSLVRRPKLEGSCLLFAIWGKMEYRLLENSFRTPPTLNHIGCIQCIFNETSEVSLNVQMIPYCKV